MVAASPNRTDIRETNMAKKKDKRRSAGAYLAVLKIGSRVCCRDGGVEGRIVWANAVAVKIQWADGEPVTWKPDALASRPIEILDVGGEDESTTMGWRKPNS
jgi:hypothetical protein